MRMPTGTESLRPFLPTKDFSLSRAFYEALGFQKVFDGEVAIFKAGDGGFILQRYYEGVGGELHDPIGRRRPGRMVESHSRSRTREKVRRSSTEAPGHAALGHTSGLCVRSLRRALARHAASRYVTWSA